MPVNWLSSILRSVRNPSEANLCATRRGAGLPFMVQVILATENSNGSLGNIFTELKELAAAGISGEDASESTVK